MDFKKIPFEQNYKIELTDAEIAAAKRAYGDIYLIEVGGKKIYMHRPTRQIFDLAQTSAMKRPSLFEETIMTNCWLAGDKEILDDTELFYGAARKVNEITKVAEAELKKL